MNDLDEYAATFVYKRNTAIFWRVTINNLRIHLGITEGDLLVDNNTPCHIDTSYIPSMDVLQHGQDTIARGIRILNMIIDEQANMYYVLERALVR